MTAQHRASAVSCQTSEEQQPEGYPSSSCTHLVRCPRLEMAPDSLSEGEEAVLHLIERIVGPLGLRLTNRGLGRMRD